MEDKKAKIGSTQKPQDEIASTKARTPQVEPLMHNLKGITIIAKNEIISHLKSTRMIVLMIIFVLTVLSGAYLFASMAASNIETRPPEFIVWSFVVDVDDGSYPNDALIITTDTEGNVVNNVKISIYNSNNTLDDVKTTDSNGTVIFENIDPLSYLNSKKGDYEDLFRPVIMSYAQITQLQQELDLYVQAQATDLDEDNVKDDVAIMVLDSSFRPVQGAYVTQGGKTIDEPYTNSNGMSRHLSLMKDDYNYNIEYNDLSANEVVRIQSDDMDIENALQLKSPDDVLMQIAGFFIAMIVPIIAIGISFDSISREKLSRSIVFLLCRPIGKRSIAAGKFIGSITALAIPLTAISLFGVWIIAARTNEAPTGSFVAGFLLVTIVLMAIFVLLQQIFSTLAKTTGNAILAGIGIWLFFYIFWSLIVFAVSSALGYQFNSMEYYNVVYKMALFSPVSSYSLIIEAISPTGGQAPIGIPEWAAFVSFALWTIVLFIIALELFRKKPYL